MFNSDSIIHESIVAKLSSQQNSTSLLREQSVKPLYKIDKHYKDVQHALDMLKMSVDELWQLELEQLGRHQLTSPNLSKTKFSTEIPTTYRCRPVLPIDNEIIEVKNKTPSTTNSLIIIHQPSLENSIQNFLSNSVKVKKASLLSNPQSLSSKKKSAKSLVSVDKKQRQHGHGDNTTKYSTKKALLHLKFRCSKHTQ